MSKKKVIFTSGGIVDPSSAGKPGEMVISKKERDLLTKILTENSGKKTETVVITAPFVHFPTAVKEAASKLLKAEENKRNMRMEDNYTAYAFLEDITYCPTQIDYYFRTPDDKVYCLYIRQRHWKTTAEIVPCDDAGNFIYRNWQELTLSREYDIEACSYKSREDEENEIIAIEQECISLLREKFPDTVFPELTMRKTYRSGEGNLTSFIDTKQS